MSTTAATDRITYPNPTTRRSIYTEGTYADCLQIAARLGHGRYRIEALEDI